MLEDRMQWDFPPSAWERALCEELKNQTPQLVPRAPADQLTGMPMHANKCHANVRWYVERDPYRESRAVCGWWVQWPDFVLHSVIETDGQMICITPTHFSETEFLFIPDSKICWIEDGEVYSAIRDGHVIGVGIRAFPSFTMARNDIVRERLLAGMDPFRAIEFSDEVMETLKREHIGS